MRREERVQREMPGQPRPWARAFQVFWVPKREREVDEVDWRGVSACAAEKLV